MTNNVVINMINENENCKIIPMYPGLMATKEGEIIDRDTGEKLIQFVGMWGTYNVVYTGSSTETVHRLVAMTWCDLPEGGNYSDLQVNHKDGDKFNNHCLNLEWVTASENRIHALVNKLAPSKWVMVKDLRNGKVTTYYGINECARRMDLPASSVSKYIRDPSKVRRLFYVFVRVGQAWPDLTSKDIRRMSDGTTNPIERHCPKTGEMVLFSSMKEAAASIDTSSALLYYNMNKYADKPYKGYVFKPCLDEKILEEHQKNYKGKAPAAHCKRKPLPITVINLKTGEKTEWISTEEFCKSVGLNRNTVRTAITRANGYLKAGFQVSYRKDLSA